MGEKIIQPPFYNSGFYNTGAGGGGGGGSSELPIVGELEHEWNFKDSFTDTIGGVTATQKTNGGNSLLGYPLFNYQYGIFLNTLCKVKDYFELKFALTVNRNSYVRLINKSDSDTINDSSAFLIGPSSDKWASYFNSWKNDMCGFELIAKVGLYLKTNETMDVFFDDVLVKEDFNNGWGIINVTKNKYAIGANTSYTDSSTKLGAVRARIYRNAERI